MNYLSESLKKATDAGLELGESVAYKLKTIASAMRGTCAPVAPEDAATATMDGRLKDTLDRLRRDRPALYEALATAAKRFGDKPPEAQRQYLESAGREVLGLAQGQARRR